MFSNSSGIWAGVLGQFAKRRNVREELHAQRYHHTNSVHQVIVHVSTCRLCHVLFYVLQDWLLGHSQCGWSCQVLEEARAGGGVCKTLQGPSWCACRAFTDCLGSNGISCTGRITAAAVTNDGLLLCTAAEDKALKVFDVLNFGWLPDA